MPRCKRCRKVFAATTVDEWKTGICPDCARADGAVPAKAASARRTRRPGVKPFVKVCESKVLRRGIVVCCGPKPAVRKLFLDPKTFPGLDLSKRLLAKQWQLVEKAWGEVLDEPGGALGFTIRDGGDVFVVLPKWDSRVFVHEAYHAAQAVLRIIGTQDEELGAFLVEWLFEEICWGGKGKR